MTYTESAVVEATLALQGVWLHQPLDPDATARHYLYGGSASQAQADLLESGSFYAGRSFPVVEYGIHQTEQVGVSIQVPHGPGWAATVAELQAWSQVRTAVLFRDGRGRNMLATLSGYTERDQRWGTQVTFTMSRVDGEA